MDVSIIIINWNSAHYIRACLESIYKHTKNLDYEVIVVDNASYDRCEEVIKDFKNVTYIQSEKNLGFAKANNLGVQRSNGKNLLFLNPDTKILSNAIYSMNFFLENSYDTAAVGCKILNSNGSIQASCVQKLPSIMNQVLDIDCLKHLFPKFNSMYVSTFILETINPIKVEVISGACIMLRRTVFDQVEGFTSDYFMYAEDVDLCYKIIKSGFAIYYLGNISIIHYGGGSSRNKTNNFINILMKESKYKFFRLRKGKLYALLYRISMLASSILRIVILMFIVPLRKSALEANLKALNKWCCILKWSLGLEKWVKNF